MIFKINIKSRTKSRTKYKIPIYTKTTISQAWPKIYQKSFDIWYWPKLKAKFKDSYSDSIDTSHCIYQVRDAEVEVNIQEPWYIDIATDDNEVLGEIEEFIAIQ